MGRKSLLKCKNDVYSVFQSSLLLAYHIYLGLCIRNCLYSLSFGLRPSLVEESEGGNAGLLRCGKSTTWEGGVRMPAIAWWPGKIQSGRTFEVYTCICSSSEN